MDELDPVFDAVAAYFSILSEPTRLKIMHSVCNGEQTVSQIVAATGSTQTNVSRHLGLMHRHGVLTRRRDGNQVYYRIADETMVELCRSVCNRIAGTIDERRPLKRQFLRLIPAAKKRVA
ncbi:MAG TPA: metalloregulator ArsR/SmtB family transcription factor [Burkholderiales bacterium]|nr:metalloregulator ArsR/SmtB family transcription factor [Burkholderiales bacterium]